MIHFFVVADPVCFLVGWLVHTDTIYIYIGTCKFMKLSRPDMTFAVECALKTSYLSHLLSNGPKSAH